MNLRRYTIFSFLLSEVLQSSYPSLSHDQSLNNFLVSEMLIKKEFYYSNSCIRKENKNKAAAAIYELIQ